MYQVMWTTGIWLGTRRKSAHASTAELRSLCAPLDLLPLLPLFFLYFWAVVVFLWFFDFFILFFWYFLSLRSTKEVSTKNMSINKWKACRKFRRRAQNWQKACDHKKMILWPVFGQNKIFQTRWRWISILSTCLSCWPIHVPSTRCIKWCEQQEYDY